MRITVTSRHFKASERLKTYASEEVRRLKKYFEPIIDCDIVLCEEKLNRSAEIKLAVKGDTFTASEDSENFEKSIDQAVAKLEKQILRYKEKMRAKH